MKKKERKTIAAVAMRAIRAGKGTDAVLAAVKARFPESETSPACVAWYRAEMRRRGERVPEGRPKPRKESR